MFVRHALAYQLQLRFRASGLSERLLALAAMCLSFSGAACLYTDPINMPPTVTIIADHEAVWRHQPVTFRADVADPNGASDITTLEWAQVPCVGVPGSLPGSCTPCPNDVANPAHWPGERVAGPTFTVDMAGTDRPSCIWAFAKDRRGATTAEIYPLNPLNHPPVADIGVVAPHALAGTNTFPSYTEIELSSSGSTDQDQDQMEFVWTLLMRPAGSNLDSSAVGSCSSPRPDSSWCFRPDVPGQYLVQLSARDKYDNTDNGISPPATISKTIDIAGDQLPCIRLVSPGTPIESWDSTQRQEFSVDNVEDDGDPFPTQNTLHFRWFKGLASDPLLEYFGQNDFNRFTVNEFEYSPADEVIVRVDVYDRNESQISTNLQNCGGKDTCGETCTQRWTWRIHYR